MTMDLYERVQQIGQGACGNVYLVKHKYNNKQYALKKIQLDETRKTRTKEAVLREARILSELKHPHIVAYHDSFFEESGELVHLSIIQDYCDGGTLDDRIKEAEKAKVNFPEKQIVDWFLQIAMAVRFLHAEKVLHRDLKTENVFLNKSATICKLGDFGIAKPMKDTFDVASTCVGTPCYLSPEMCQDIPYSSKADVWALGCLLYETCALRPAFDANNLVSLFYKIVKAEFEPIPDIYSAELHDVVDRILIKSADDRPSARGVLRIPYLQKQLRQFIEDKEDLLQQVRLPTRQGSRPYSTPTYCGTGLGDVITPTTAATAVKRAISCRPNVGLNVTVDKPTSRGTGSRVVDESGRVSTIPEEPEEHTLEKTNNNISTTKKQDGRPADQVHEKGRRREYHEPSLERAMMEKTLRQSRQASPIKLGTQLDNAALESRSRSRSPVVQEHTKLTLQLRTLEPDTAAVDQYLNVEQSADYSGELNIELESSAEEQTLHQQLDNQKNTSTVASSGDETVSVNNSKNRNNGRNVGDVKNIKEISTDRTPSVNDKPVQPVRPKTTEGKRKGSTTKTPDLQMSKRLSKSFNESHTTGKALHNKDRNTRGSKQDKNNARHGGGQQHGKMGHQKENEPNRRGKNNSEGGNAAKTLRLHDKAAPAQRANNQKQLDASQQQQQQQRAQLTTQNLQQHQAAQNKQQQQPLQQLQVPPQHPRPHAPAAGSRRNHQQIITPQHTSSVQRRSGRRSQEAQKSGSNVPDDYSDDFDEDSTASEHSDVEEEIPEEIPDSGKPRKTRSFSFASQNNEFHSPDLLTQFPADQIPTIEIDLDASFDVPEIPEDLPEGKEATDLDLNVDGEPDEIEEELDGVLHVARDAYEDLDSTEVHDDEDETIVDRSGLRSAASRIIERHCVETLGEENYKNWKTYCQNNQSSHQTRKIEKTFGTENMDTLNLMREVVSQNSNHKT